MNNIIVMVEVKILTASRITFIWQIFKTDRVWDYYNFFINSWQIMYFISKYLYTTRTGVKAFDTVL